MVCKALEVRYFNHLQFYFWLLWCTNCSQPDAGRFSLLSPNYRRKLIVAINLSMTSIGTSSTSSLQREVLILLLFTQRKAILAKMLTHSAYMKTQADKLYASCQEALQVKDKESEILIYGSISTRMLNLTQIDFMWLSSFVFSEENNENDKIRPLQHWFWAVFRDFMLLSLQVWREIHIIVGAELCLWT